MIYILEREDTNKHNVLFAELYFINNYNCVYMCEFSNVIILKMKLQVKKNFILYSHEKLLCIRLYIGRTLVHTSVHK